MHLAIMLLATCLLVAACKEDREPAEKSVEQPEIFVGRSIDSEWPYRYTVVRSQSRWTGEIEIVSGEESIFFDKMDVVSSRDHEIMFEALFGGPGKALPMSWKLSLSKSGNNGLDGLLVAKDRPDEFKPIKLKFVATKSATLPSSEFEDKLQAMDGDGYRAEAALEHEVAMAKREWEHESKIAEQISVLRMDDEMRGGIRREWVGPAWVRDQVKAEDSKYFKKICGIYLGGTAVTDRDVQAISSLTKLRELYLHRTGITDAALEQIGHLQALRILHLRNTRVTDRGLEELRELTNLRELYLFETKISDEGGSKLRLALPNTDIQW